MTLETKIPENTKYLTQGLTSHGKPRCLVPMEVVIHILGYKARSLGALGLCGVERKGGAEPFGRVTLRTLRLGPQAPGAARLPSGVFVRKETNSPATIYK